MIQLVQLHTQDSDAAPVTPRTYIQILCTLQRYLVYIKSVQEREKNVLEQEMGSKGKKFSDRNFGVENSHVTKKIFVYMPHDTLLE